MPLKHLLLCAVITVVCVAETRVRSGRWEEEGNAVRGPRAGASVEEEDERVRSNYRTAARNCAPELLELHRPYGDRDAERPNAGEWRSASAVMRPKASEEARDPDRLVEVLKVRKIYHSAHPEKLENGRNIVNYQRGRDRKNAPLGASDDFVNTIYKKTN